MDKEQLIKDVPLYDEDTYDAFVILMGKFVKYVAKLPLEKKQKSNLIHFMAVAFDINPYSGWELEE